MKHPVARWAAVQGEAAVKRRGDWAAAPCTKSASTMTAANGGVWRISETKPRVALASSVAAPLAGLEAVP